jgi:sulfopyruvate decarboxylase TPP-binding subunit
MPSSANAAASRSVSGLSGESIIKEINASGVEFVISVPDITTSEGLLRPLAKGAGPRLIRICKEDEGVAICAGLAFTGKRGLLLIQQTGLLDSINAVRGVAVEYGLPICMMVGLLEKEPGVMPRQSKRYGVRIVEPILEAMGIGYHNIEEQSDVAKIRPAIDAAYKDSKPTVILIGQRPTA